MRLVTVEHRGTERLGVRTADGVLVAAAGRAPTRIEGLLEDPTEGLSRLRQLVEDSSAGKLAPFGEVRTLAPVPRPPNVVCIGKNYVEHAAEEGAEMPADPLVFLKHTSSVTGPDSEIVWSPALTEQVDWEAELAVVIATRTWQVSEADALGHVLGYTCVNDVSARDIQFSDGQWARGKSLETFCPMGPDIVTADEIADPQALSIRCLVNGTVMQESTTALMYHSVARIISYCSQAFPLLPGDVVATGTPAGVGIFRDPPVTLADGDEVVVEIDGVGRLVNRCRTTD